MSQVDRHRFREEPVPLEYEPNETFTALPPADRVSMVLLSGGKASLLLNGKAVTLTAPCILLLSPRDTAEAIKTMRLAARSFHFHPTFLNSALTFEQLERDDFSALEDIHDRNMLLMFLYRDAQYNGVIDLPADTFVRVSEWMAAMGTEVHAQSDLYWTCRIRRYLLQTLYLLDDIYMKTPAAEAAEKDPVDIVTEYIHVHYADDISLDDLCRLVHLSRTTLTRRFKQQRGCTALEYLLRHRLRVACDALSHTALSLMEVAQAIGFKYGTYFIKQFTAHMGESPSVYRWRTRGYKYGNKKPEE